MGLVRISILQNCGEVIWTKLIFVATMFYRDRESRLPGSSEVVSTAPPAKFGDMIEGKLKQEAREISLL